MVWKIIGYVVLAWIALMIIGWLLKVLLPMVIIGAVLFGVFVLYKAAAGKDRNPVARP